LGDRDVGENRVVVPPLQTFGGRWKVLRDALVAQVVPYHDEAVSLGIRQRTNQYRIDGAEDGGVRADAKREL